MPQSAVDTTDRIFAPGALVPAWPVRDDNGRPTDLRSMIEGRAAVVLCIARPASPKLRQAVKRLTELGSRQAQPPMRVVLLPPTTHGEDVVALAHDGVRIAVLRDAEELGDERRPTWAVTDKAARVLHSGRIQPAEISRLDAHLEAPKPAPRSDANVPRRATAPVLIIPDVFDAGLCRRLIAHFDQSKTHPSGVLDLSGPEPAWRPDPDIKQRRDMRLEDPALTREIEQAMAARVLPEIRKCFHYVVTHHEPFKLVRYDTGSGYFRPHRDNETRDTDYRRFAMTINLNTGDYDGGALQFPEFGETLYRPPRGGAIVFSCSLLHEATDVTRGSRYVALGFFYNPTDGLTAPPPT
ncbi:MAG: 2OG-Fe(II) oxygenase [Gammaproteobacteria bacterium]